MSNPFEDADALYLGHSLLAAVLVARMEDQFGITICLRDFLADLSVSGITGRAPLPATGQP